MRFGIEIGGGLSPEDKAVIDRAARMRRTVERADELLATSQRDQYSLHEKVRSEAQTTVTRVADATMAGDFMPEKVLSAMKRRTAKKWRRELEELYASGLYNCDSQVAYGFMDGDEKKVITAESFVFGAEISHNGYPVLNVNRGQRIRSIDLEMLQLVEVDIDEDSATEMIRYLESLQERVDWQAAARRLGLSHSIYTRDQFFVPVEESLRDHYNSFVESIPNADNFFDFSPAFGNA